MQPRECLLALHLTGVVGPRRLKAARDAFPDLEALFGATEEALSRLPDWTGPSARRALSLKDPLERVGLELEEAERSGIQVLVEVDGAFPAVFGHLYDPPFVLWLKGSLEREDERAIAVIGCRKPSAYGKAAALRLSEDIAKSGYTVVSGLARGIDSTAHQGALRHPGGRTLAFLGSGLLNLYPPENKDLAGRIAERGAVLSEYPLRAKPLSMHFPQRNRLISAASKGLLVVEAKKDSGSFITVDHAMDQGKPVFAVPGPITHQESEGAHALIQQGAKLVMGVEDIFQELQDLGAQSLFRSSPKGPRAALGDLTEEESLVLSKMTYRPLHVDELLRETALAVRRLNEVLFSLEMKGAAQQAPGHCYFKL